MTDRAVKSHVPSPTTGAIRLEMGSDVRRHDSGDLEIELAPYGLAIVKIAKGEESK